MHWKYECMLVTNVFETQAVFFMTFVFHVSWRTVFHQNIVHPNKHRFFCKLFPVPSYLMARCSNPAQSDFPLLEAFLLPRANCFCFLWLPLCWLECHFPTAFLFSYEIPAPPLSWLRAPTNCCFSVTDAFHISHSGSPRWQRERSCQYFVSPWASLRCQNPPPPLDSWDSWALSHIVGSSRLLPFRLSTAWKAPFLCSEGSPGTQTQKPGAWPGDGFSQLCLDREGLIIKNHWVYFMILATELSFSGC